MGKLATGNIGIQGLYEWGNGYVSSEASRVWNEYWLSKVDDHNSELVVTYKNNSWGKSFYLVGCGILVYLHPMGDSFTMETSNSAETEKFEYDIKDIAKQLDGLAAFVKEKMGIDLKYAIEWKVLKEEYNPTRYVPDDDEVRRIANY